MCFKVLLLIHFIISFYCHFSSSLFYFSLSTKTPTTPTTISRTCRTRRSIGMKLVSSAINVVFHWLTNNSVQRPRRFIAAIVMTHSLPVAVMAVGKFFVRVRMVQFNSFNFTIFFSISLSLPLSLSLALNSSGGLFIGLIHTYKYMYMVLFI